MIRINLLPYREARRRERRRQFYVVAALMVGLGATIGLAGHMFMSQQIAAQDSRNQFVERQLRALDDEIEQISRLREQIDALLARKQVIESLQQDRGQAVHLFNELVFRLPEGVSLQTVRQSNAQVTLTGRAQSNARVSRLMRNLEASPFLERPRLVEVRSDNEQGRRLSTFTLDIHLAQLRDARDMEAAQ